MHHDMDDAVRAGILTEDEIPAKISDVVGAGAGERLDFFIRDLISTSYGQNDILLSPPVAQAMQSLREFMFERVYQNPEAKSEEKRAEAMMETLYAYYFQHLDKIPPDIYKLLEKGDPAEQLVCDFLSAMTDRFAIAQYTEIYVPKSWIL